ncbi:MAG: hypothetical protein MSG64_13890 [Pyrinomonadaceae bacterium MAG19_C2-C3]|nr:hypothetical protein [Pyrinomonadaceae bacterium MAG19_C2-C3]
MKSFQRSNLRLLAAIIFVANIGAPHAFAQSKATARPSTDTLIQTPNKSNTRSGLTKHDDEARQESDSVLASTVADDASPATYTYEFEQPQFTVPKFRVTHDAEGKATVTFERRNEPEPYTEQFTISPTALSRINDLLLKLDFLNSTESYQAEKDFSHLGTSTFNLQRDGRARTAKFNYTKNPDAALLATEYRRVMDQVLFVFDINLARTNQPLEAPGIMKRLEILVARNGISDTGQIAVILRDLTTDERIPLIARNKAEKLLKKIEK